MYMRRAWVLGGIAMLLVGLTAFPAAAAPFAAPAFQTQWAAGEALTANFWGPLSTASDGRQEYYRDAQSGQRTVQYFEKGRMEYTDPPGVITNGLLPVEMIRGRVQLGNDLFVSRTPPQIPIAGDQNGGGPTYASISSRGGAVLLPTAANTGAPITTFLSGSGDVSQGDASATTLSGYDARTQHNVASVFVDYRNRAGLATIGYAISEPFRAAFMVSGQPRDVIVQVFERRVLTYTPKNNIAFQVEMGNVGQHYSQWRYPPGAAPILPPL